MIADQTGEYEYNLKEDWKRFVANVGELMHAHPDWAVEDFMFHTGAHCRYDLLAAMDENQIWV